MKKYFLFFLTVALVNAADAQTFFDTAEGDGIISFSNSKLHQVKMNFSSSAFTYGYYYRSGSVSDTHRFLLQAEAGFKPGDDGIVKVIESGKANPGASLKTAIGIRFNDVLFPNNWSVLDLYFKPEYTLSQYTIYDTTQLLKGEKPQYDKTKHSLGLNGLLNYGMALGKSNLYLGVQYGVYFSDNTDTLSSVTLQTVKPVPGQSNQFVFSDSKEAKSGTFENVTKQPLKVDVMVDPSIPLNKKDSTNVMLGFFGYWRTDLHYNTGKNRVAFGICLIKAEDPSKIFTSLGFELPIFGSGLTSEERKDNKGMLFATIGYTFSKSDQ